LAWPLTEGTGASTGPSACGAGRLTVRVATQGENTTERADLVVSTRAATCRLSGSASLTIMHNGRRVGSIRGNPLAYRVDLVVSSEPAAILGGDWDNWCGSRRSLTVTGRVGTLVATAEARPLPVCLQARAPSRLVAVIVAATTAEPRQAAREAVWEPIGSQTP
jgi:hypothetical protein